MLSPLHFEIFFFCICEDIIFGSKQYLRFWIFIQEKFSPLVFFVQNKNIVFYLASKNIGLDQSILFHRFVPVQMILVNIGDESYVGLEVFTVHYFKLVRG